MKAPRSPAARILVSLALIGFVHVGDAQAQDAASHVKVLKIRWAPCGDDFPGIECATVRVPLDYDDPDGPTTKLALARLPASNKSRIGTLFLNPGGPGGSGVDLVLFGFADFVSFVTDGRFDIVGFDPRGVGSSEPLRCFRTEQEFNDFFATTPLFPWRASQERPFFDDYRAFGQQCLGRDRRITAHMSTADVVRDLDLLRRAVGDSRLNYLGFSYGSYIGITYANLYPDKIRALVIDGVLNPRLWANGWQVKSDRVATADVFDEFLRLCDEAAADCALAATGSAKERYDALAKAIKREPVVFDDGFVYSYDFLVFDSLSTLHVPEFWGGPDGMAAFFASLADAVLGVPGAARHAREQRRSIEQRIRDAAPRQEQYDNSYDAFYGNHCADTQYPHSFDDFARIGDYAARGSVLGSYWWWQNASCAGWPVAPDRYVGPWSTRTSKPVLIVGNFHDPATDYAGAVASSEFLRNSRLLSYAGWGHTAFGRSECATTYVAEYLVSGKLPPVGTLCPANPNPFLPVTTLRKAGPVAPLIGVRPPRPGGR